MAPSTFSGVRRGAASLASVLAYGMVLLLVAAVVRAGVYYQERETLRAQVASVRTVVDLVYGLGVAQGGFQLARTPASRHCPDVPATPVVRPEDDLVRWLRLCRALPAGFVPLPFTVALVDATTVIRTVEAQSALGYRPYDPLGAGAGYGRSGVVTSAGAAYRPGAESTALATAIERVRRWVFAGLRGSEDFALEFTGAGFTPDVCAALLRADWPRAFQVAVVGGAVDLAAARAPDGDAGLRHGQLPGHSSTYRVVGAGSLTDGAAVTTAQRWRGYLASAPTDDAASTLGYVRFVRAPGAVYHPSAPVRAVHEPGLVLGVSDARAADAVPAWPPGRDVSVCRNDPRTGEAWVDAAGYDVADYAMVLSFGGGALLGAE